MIDYIRNPENKTATIVYSFVNCSDLAKIAIKLNIKGIKYYLF
jgi:hypothetical protein